MASPERWSHWELLLGAYVYVFTMALSAWLGEVDRGTEQIRGAPHRLVESSRRTPLWDAQWGPRPTTPGLGGKPLAMASIPAGNYLPFFKATATSKTISVQAFLLDAAVVSRDQYLDFVLHSDAWSKSRAPALFAEPTYLADWPGDHDSGPTAGNLPVTYVSWFAARAYCAFRGKRLPTLAEWEMAAATPSGRRLLQLPAAGVATDARIRDTLDEWILDFNSTLVSGRSIDQPSDLFCGAGARANDASDYGAFSRYTFRSSLRANFALRRLSFRCARDAP